MTRKTSEAYVAVFEFIERNLLELKPVLFMTDYEDGMRSAIRKRWPNVQIRGCWFHLKRAINRKCRSFGLKRTMDQNPNARKVREMLVSIPLLPSTQIHEGYNSIKKFARGKQLGKRFANLFSYFERYWLKQVRNPSQALIRYKLLFH